MSRSIHLAALLTLSLMAGKAWADGEYFSVAYPPSTEPGELVFGVTYTVWIPPGVDRLRAVIVHQHGCGAGACKGGETAAFDLHWQALARKWNCALLGPSYQQPDDANCRLWCDPRKGSEKAFLRALDDLAKKSGRPELALVPWCLWGHSGGGFWASLMQTMHPERIVAIWLRSGTAYERWTQGEIEAPLIPEEAYKIPVICNPGLKERDDPRFRSAWTGALAMFRAYRAQGAPIGFAPDPRTGHECGDSRYLAIPFFDACLEMRLPPVEGSDPSLRQASEQDLWLAAPESVSAYPAADRRPSEELTVWLPGERFARAWEQYVRTGAVEDGSPPPAPFSVRAARTASNDVEIVWDCVADLESGVRAFVLERDGERIAVAPATATGRFGRPLFQTMSYHDTPEAPLPDMRYVDEAAPAEGQAVYRVIAVNSVEMESEPSTPAQWSH